VCWEATNPCAAWISNPDNRANPNFDFHSDPTALVAIEGYVPTCYDARTTDRITVASGDLTSITPVGLETLQGVRCISETLKKGIAHKACTLSTFQQASDYCDTYVDETTGVADYRLPSSPLEAGRLCGSGCGYDVTSANWATTGGIAGVWVGFVGERSHDRADTHTRSRTCAYSSFARLLFLPAARSLRALHTGRACDDTVATTNLPVSRSTPPRVVGN
jgi:hypothetical protein